MESISPSKMALQVADMSDLQAFPEYPELVILINIPAEERLSEEQQFLLTTVFNRNFKLYTSRATPFTIEKVYYAHNNLNARHVATLMATALELLPEPQLCAGFKIMNALAPVLNLTKDSVEDVFSQFNQLASEQPTLGQALLNASTGQNQYLRAARRHVKQQIAVLADQLAQTCQTCTLVAIATPPGWPLNTIASLASYHLETDPFVLPGEITGMMYAVRQGVVVSSSAIRSI